MGIEVAIRHRQGDFMLDVAFASAGGCRLLMPPGSGSLVRQTLAIEP